MLNRLSFEIQKGPTEQRVDVPRRQMVYGGSRAFWYRTCQSTKSKTSQRFGPGRDEAVYESFKFVSVFPDSRAGSMPKG